MSIMTKLSMAISNIMRPDAKSGSESVGLGEFSEAIQFFNKLGISVTSDRSYEHRTQIIFDPLHTGEPEWKNTYEVRLNRTQLIDLYKKISSLGLCGFNIIHAIVDAIESVEDDVYLHTNFAGTFDKAIAYAKNFLEIHGLPTHVSIGSARVIDFALGGYKGVRSIATEALIAWSDSIENEHEWIPEFSCCNICKNCKTNNSFAAYCTKCKIKVDEMSLEDFGQKYAGASIDIGSDGLIMSEWIVKAIPECPFHKDRRPIKKELSQEKPVINSK